MATENNRLKPWAEGPFELIRHAEGHRSENNDFDKRMALVSYDNAIEVSITTFLQLNPLQRGGRTYERKAVESWLLNFHSKLQFLDHYATTEGIPIEVSIDEIIWFHQLRNELYHSGNGMTPEGKALDGARKAACWVFGSLFGVDVVQLLKNVGTETSKRVELRTGFIGSAKDVGPAIESAGAAMFRRVHSMSISPDRGSASTLFLETFIEMERKLLGALRAMGVTPDQVSHVPARHGWAELHKRGLVPEAMMGIVQKAVVVRNRVVHGKPVELDEDELLNLAMDVEQLTRYLVDRCRQPPGDGGTR